MRTIVETCAIVAGVLLACEAMATEMPELARENRCDSCHAIEAKMVGPSWMEVSKKYKKVAKYEFEGKEYALEDGLVLAISRGHGGNWGSIPMVASDPYGRRQDAMRELTRFILDLSNPATSLTASGNR